MPTCWLSSERDVTLVDDHKGRGSTTTGLLVDKSRPGITFYPPAGGWGQVVTVRYLSS
jgi:hypothetical protein